MLLFPRCIPVLYLIDLRVVLMVMAGVHGVVRVVLMVMEPALRAEGLGVRSGGPVGEGLGSRGEEDERAVAHVCTFTAGDVSTTVAARVAHVAAGALGKTRELKWKDTKDW